MNSPTVPTTGRNFLPSGPMMSVSWPSKNSMMISSDVLAACRGRGDRLRAARPKNSDQEDGHDEDHDHVVGDAVGGIGDLDAEEAEEGGHGRPEEAVEEHDDAEGVL